MSEVSSEGKASDQCEREATANFLESRLLGRGGTKVKEKLKPAFYSQQILNFGKRNFFPFGPPRSRNSGQIDRNRVVLVLLAVGDGFQKSLVESLPGFKVGDGEIFVRCVHLAVRQG